MASQRTTSVLRPSVLDRLLQPKGAASYPTIGLRELKAAVARDLEWLLNAKNVLGREPGVSGLPEARASVLTYGIPDYSMMSSRSSNDVRRITSEIAGAIRIFEPRLVPATVRVTMLPPGALEEFNMRFRIEGTLHVEPISEPVFFDSGLQTSTGEVVVDGSL